MFLFWHTVAIVLLSVSSFGIGYVYAKGATSFIFNNKENQ
jgi:hypothetical protein